MLSRPGPSLDVLRWTTVVAVLSVSAPILAIALHQDLTLHRHLAVLGAAWVVLVAVLLLALRFHRLLLIAETKRADLELSSVKSRFETLAEGMGNDSFLYEHDAAGVFVFLSRSVTSILGWSVEEFKAHYTTYLTDHPVNRDVVAHTDGSLAGIQQEAYPVEIRRKDGATRWLEVYEVPVRDPSGKVSSVLGIARDRTKRRHVEKGSNKSRRPSIRPTRPSPSPAPTGPSAWPTRPGLTCTATSPRSSSASTSPCSTPPDSWGATSSPSTRP